MNEKGDVLGAKEEGKVQTKERKKEREKVIGGEKEM